MVRPHPRYVSTLKVVDAYASLWCKLNDKSGKQLFGQDARYLPAMKENNEPEYREYINGHCGRLRRLNVMVKNESYQGETKRVFTLVGVSGEVNKENKGWLGMLEAYSQLPS